MAAEETDRRVSTLELFTDLVFVFAITQLTTLLSDDTTPRGVLEVVLIFGVLWWMFGGYVYLTNAMAIDRKNRKLLLLVGMMGFLLTALATPTTFHGGGLVFGFGYLIVVLVHSGLFLYSSGQRTGDIFRWAPMNVVGATLLLVAGVVQGTAAYVLFALALAGQVVSSIVSSGSGTFRLRASHLVERYGLLVLIVLGESIVAIGVGAEGLPLDASLVSAALVALAITSAMWWLYFSGDDVRAEEALATASNQSRIRLALLAFFYATIPMLLGVVAFAAGVKSAIAHAFDPMALGPAMALAFGLALYLLGDVIFRLSIGSGRTGGRMVAAVVCLGAIPLGLTAGAFVEMMVLLVILLALITLEHYRSYPEVSRPAA